MRLKTIAPTSIGCSYCGAKPGEKCIVTLAPEVGPLSVAWSHNTREEQAA